MGRVGTNRALRTGVTAAVLLGAAAGCVLFVDPDDPFGPHCRFAGADSACGTCLKERCSSAVDACCAAGDGCSASLEACATGSCAAAGGGGSEAWALCARESCAVECSTSPGELDSGPGEVDAGDGDARADAATPPKVTSCTKAGDWCQCKVDGGANGVACSQATVRNARCCASSTWPSSGTCTCEVITCEINSFGCECGLVDNGPLDTCEPTTSRPSCCARRGLGTCLCNQKICTSADGDEVASCTGPTTPCPGDKQTVTSCSF